MTNPISRADVELALAALAERQERRSIRAVAKAITAITGTRPSHSTISRLLSEIDATPTGDAATPPPSVTQHLLEAAPEVWRRSLDQARTAVAGELARISERMRTAEDQTSELQDLLAEAQERLAAAEQLVATERAAHANATNQWQQSLAQMGGRLDVLGETLRAVERDATTRAQLAQERIAALQVESERHRIAALHAQDQAAEARRERDTALQERLDARTAGAAAAADAEALRGQRAADIALQDALQATVDRLSAERAADAARCAELARALGAAQAEIDALRARAERPVHQGLPRHYRPRRR